MTNVCKNTYRSCVRVCMCDSNIGRTRYSVYRQQSVDAWHGAGHDTRRRLASAALPRHNLRHVNSRLLTTSFTESVLIGVASCGALGGTCPLNFQLVILGITHFTDSGESCARFSVQ